MTHGSRAISNVAAACLAVFCSYVPLSAVVVAEPTIGQSLHASSSDLTWALDALVLPMSAFILTAGTLADLLGRRRVLMGGLVLVIIGAGLGLASRSSIELLWAADATLGLGTAVLLPSSLAVISHALPEPRRRAPAVAAWASSLAVAIATGMWLTTLVIDGIGAHWQWLYAAMLPGPLLGLVLAGWGVDESREPEGRGFDAPGQLAGVAFVVALVYAVIQGPGHGWGSTLVICSFAIAAVALVTLIAVERRARAPMLPGGLFSSPAFAVTGVAAALMMFGMIGSVFLLSLFFGSVQHLGVSAIALRFLFLFGPLALIGPLAARATDRLGARAVLSVGLTAAAGGLFSLVGLHADSSSGAVMWRLALTGGGVGTAFAPLTAAAIASVPPALAGLAGSANNAFRQTGGALGPAVLGAVLTGQIVSRLPHVLAAHHVAPATAAHVTALVRADGTGALGRLGPGPHGVAIQHAAGDAFASALHTSATIGAIALLAAVALVLVFLRPRRHGAGTATGDVVFTAAGARTSPQP